MCPGLVPFALAEGVGTRQPPGWPGFTAEGLPCLAEAEAPAPGCEG
jgi:hypothetical protein